MYTLTLGPCPPVARASSRRASSRWCRLAYSAMGVSSLTYDDATSPVTSSSAPYQVKTASFRAGAKSYVRPSASSTPNTSALPDSSFTCA